MLTLFLWVCWLNSLVSKLPTYKEQFEKKIPVPVLFLVWEVPLYHLAQVLKFMRLFLRLLFNNKYNRLVKKEKFEYIFNYM